MDLDICAENSATNNMVAAKLVDESANDECVSVLGKWSLNTTAHNGLILLLCRENAAKHSWLLQAMQLQYVIPSDSIQS